MNVILFDDSGLRENLLPFTFTRPIAEIRIGILTLQEKWSHWLAGATLSCQPPEYLQAKFPPILTGDDWFILGALLPDEGVVNAIKALNRGDRLKKGEMTLAWRSPDPANPQGGQVHEYASEPGLLTNTWTLFRENGAQIRADFQLLTAGRTSQPVTDPHTVVYRPDQVFLEEGVYLRSAILNAETGPIYLGRGVIIQEGAIIRGAFGAGDYSHVNMGARIRGDVSMGPYCKIGGEVSNSILFGYSNKAHDGFLGNSVLGEWCNLGADTNTSNLKNNYDEIKLWQHGAGRFVKTGLQFCGLMMGDHSKSAINTMFNTATVVDVASNVFGAGFPRNYIPSFSWGGPQGFETYQLQKALETAKRVYARRERNFDAVEESILTHIFHLTSASRIWENRP